MNTLHLKFILGMGLVVLLSQQSVFADDRPFSHRDGREVKQWQQGPASRQADYRRDDHPSRVPEPYYKPYYKSGHNINPPLPRGHSRVFVNATEYFYFDGFFYRPARQGYVVVDAPIGAIVTHLPRFNEVAHWRRQPYYVVGNTFYRKHRNGYVVVPNPGFGYRR